MSTTTIGYAVATDAISVASDPASECRLLRKPEENGLEM
jgi:hypothetical protein